MSGEEPKPSLKDDFRLAFGDGAEIQFESDITRLQHQACVFIVNEAPAGAVFRTPTGDLWLRVADDRSPLRRCSHSFAVTKGWTVTNAMLAGGGPLERVATSWG